MIRKGWRRRGSNATNDGLEKSMQTGTVCALNTLTLTPIAIQAIHCLAFENCVFVQLRESNFSFFAWELLRSAN